LFSLEQKISAEGKPKVQLQVCLHDAEMPQLSSLLIQQDKLNRWLTETK
jgi:hypothetical protein